MKMVLRSHILVDLNYIINVVVFMSYSKTLVRFLFCEISVGAKFMR